jgi:hypothetical protein
VRALQDWRAGSLLLAIVAAAVYGPAIDRVFAADQLWYFAETGGQQTLAAGLRHLDYAITRVYWRGDDLLFRPLLFTWLAVANAGFGYHHTWWNLANLAIHVAVAIALLRLLLAIRPSVIAIPAALLFLVLEPPLELVLWNHLGGYLLACVFLAIGLRGFVRLMEGAAGPCACARYAIPLTAASLAYEAMVPIALAAAAARLVGKRERPSAADTALLLSPVLIFATLYGIHALNAPRLDYVDRADGRTVFDVANVGNVVTGMARMVAAWSSELALPTALQLSSDPFQRFAKAFRVNWSDAAVIANIAALVLLLGVFSFSVSRRRARQVGPLLAVLLTGAAAYTFLIAFGRSADEVAATTYYAYVFAVLLLPLGYALIDFDRLRGRTLAVAAVAVLAFAAVHAAGTIAAVEAVERVNRYPALYLTRVIRFVDAHRSEPGFSFSIEEHPESLDPHVTLVAGYPHDPAAPRLERRVTELLFAPYYDGHNPKYVLSASAEWVVRQP